MVFSSAPFVFVFLPVVLALYLLIPSIKVQNGLLILASLFFYAYGEPIFVLFMILSVLINYLLARGIVSDVKRRQLYLILAVVFDLTAIGVFKYAAFFVETVNALLPVQFGVPRISLPIGISFFTFQVLSYVIDVYREPAMVQKDYFKVLLYVSFFPQLIAGPIVKYHDVYSYIMSRKKDAGEIADGIKRFIIGLAKKMFLANAMGAIADAMFTLAPSSISTLTAWVGAIAYALQIFFDFSAYSDMAIGIGHMFGFTFLENFKYPYVATSMKEFWRRWHISLSTWFKEYLYIPLGGNRKGYARTQINLLIVFFATGLWHGASWSFVVWGMIHGIAEVIENVLHIRDFTKHHKWIGRLYTLLIVITAFVLFRADDFALGGRMISCMFIYHVSDITAFNTVMSVLTPWHIFLFLIALIASTPFIKNMSIIIKRHKPYLYRLSYAFCMLLLGLCFLSIANSSYNPFIYFRF